MSKKKRPTVGRTIGHAIDSTVGSVGKVGHAVTSTLRLAGLTSHRGTHAKHHHYEQPGAIPGLEGFVDRNTPPEPDTVHYTVHDYGPDHFETYPVDDIEALFRSPRPEGAQVRWINVDGLHPWVVQQFVNEHGFHTLAAEDTLHVPQRPKAESYDDHLFAVARMMQLHDHELRGEQISFYLLPGLLVTFQENHGDCWAPVRERLGIEGSRIRKSGADYLLYALIDAVVDHCFPILERFGDMLEDLEPQVIEDPSPSLISRIYGIKRELAMLRRVLWPTRELVNVLTAETTREISPQTKLFLRDVQEHCVQLVEIIETFRDMTSSLTDLHMSAVSNRMNEVMKFLTILGSLFIPITFLAGIYGMNFDHIPELKMEHAYPIFWGVCGAVTIGLLIYFYRKGWIGKD